MNLSVGIVGLPNVGKSTLFNALLKKQQALVANYPFATIEPNVGVVAVPDERLTELARIEQEEYKMQNLPPIVPATVRFVDIAGLVKGAAEGAGLGNKFLSHIREVSILAHVVRSFKDENVIKEGSIDPKSDYDNIQTELILADLTSLQKASDNKKIEPEKKSAIEKLIAGFNKGMRAHDIQLTEEEHQAVRELFLLTGKPEIIVLNVSETDYSKDANTLISEYAAALTVSKEKILVICAKIEAELAALTEGEQVEYLKELGIQQSGLDRLIQKAYETLNLCSFLTAGEKEVRAWTIEKGTDAQNAAGVIHTDFIKHFIKAEVVSLGDFLHSGGWKKARDLGKTRFEGRDYVMQDGDVVEFKIGS